MIELEKIESQIKWAKENIPYASPLDNLDIKDVEWLIKKVKKQEKEIWALNKEIGKYSNMVSDIAKSQIKLTDETRKLAKIMLFEEGNTP